MRYKLFVPGIPKTAGSKRAFVNKKTGRANIVDDCKKGADWKADIKAFACKEYNRDPHQGPVIVKLSFHLPRPKYHYGTGKNAGILKDSAEGRPHITKPDIDKLSRAVLDALTGIVWKDDAQIINKQCEKIYDSQPGVAIRIETIGAQQSPFAAPRS